MEEFVFEEAFEDADVPLPEPLAPVDFAPLPERPRKTQTITVTPVELHEVFCRALMFAAGIAIINLRICERIK